MIPIFKALIRPTIEYANTVWCPYLKKDIIRIEKIQKKFTKKISGMSGKSYHQRLKKLRLPSLEYRRLRGDLIEAFKIIKGIYDPISTQNLFQINTNTRTRNNMFKLTKKRFNMNPFKYFFTNRLVNVWNSLPTSIVNTDSVNVFKNKLDMHFKNYKYCTNINLYYKQKLVYTSHLLRMLNQ